MNETIEMLTAFCRENDRVCPLHQQWSQLWEMLPNRKRQGSGWLPALPLVLTAWHDTPAMLKMLRLGEHIEWTDRHGVLDEVAAFLGNLPEDQWHHLGE